MRRGRLSYGRRRLWEEALREIHLQRRAILAAAALFFGVILVANLFPRTPAYERGLLTGAFLAGLAWLFTWRVWVTSGLGHRLNGVWAEEGTGEVLRSAKGVHAVVPNFPFDGYDVDQVVIAAAGVFAIETKWHYRCDSATLARNAHRAATTARSLRLNLRTMAEGLPSELVRPILVVWGRGARDLDRTVIETSLGDVDIIPGRQLAAWAHNLGRGPVGPDWASTLASALTEIARQREKADRESNSRLLRYVSRPR